MATSKSKKSKSKNTAKKKTPKKSLKKAKSKNKKASVKKAPAKKAPAKKAAKKATKKASKKVAAKSASKKSAARSAKKSAKKSAVKPSVKAKSKTSAPKAAAPKKTSLVWENFFTPLDDRLVVKLEGPSEKTAGGLYIPSSVEERPNQGEVLLAGRGKKDKKGRIRPMDVKAGEKVLFGTYSGLKMLLNNQEVLMLREEDIMGVVD